MVRRSGQLGAQRQILEELVHGVSPASNTDLAADPHDESTTACRVAIGVKKSRVQTAVTM